VFITVDPERDTKELMKGYVTNFGATIEGLTGTQEQIGAVTPTPLHINQGRAGCPRQRTPARRRASC